MACAVCPNATSIPVSQAAYVRRASRGSRTRNPRITNAVLCQLKLGWRRDFRRHPRETTTLKNGVPTVNTCTAAVAARNNQRHRRLRHFAAGLAQKNRGP